MTHPAYELDWNLIRTFVAVVDGGSLAAAARQLGFAHPTVARHIQTLEQNLGVSLFERSSAGLAINEVGSQLAEAAVRMQKNAVAFEAVSDAVKTSSVGTVRITIAELFAELFPALLSPLQQFNTARRTVELVISNQSLNLLERECDIAIRHFRPVQAELICRKVGSLFFGAWASRDYIHANGTPTLETMHQHWFIDSGKGHFQQATERAGIPIPTDRIAFKTDSIVTQRHAALAGWGIVGLPLYLGAKEQDLVEVLRTDNLFDLDVWVVARPQVRHTLMLKQVFEHVSSVLNEFLNNPQNLAYRDAEDAATQKITNSQS